MVAGELGLGTTFWKYGVLFLLILTFIVKFFEKLLHRQTGSTDLLYFSAVTLIFSKATR